MWKELLGDSRSGKKLELRRVAEPCLPRTPGVELTQEEPRAWVPATARLEASGAVGHSRFPWPRGGARAPGGGLTGVGQPLRPRGPPGGGSGDRLAARARGWRRRGQRSPEVEGNQGWRPSLWTLSAQCPEPLARAGLKLIFDPSRDLCLKLAAARILAEQTWPWDRESWESPRVG